MNGVRDDLYQSNYISESIKRSMTKLSLQCPNVAFVIVQEDDENISQIQYIHGVYSSISSENLIFEYIENIRLVYDDQCKPQWQVGVNNTHCLLNTYPKEWMITEIT